MAITYTTKLNLAKPAHGDVDWHMPINENWDSIDSKLGPLYENIEVGTSEITIDKKVVVDEIVISNFVSSSVILDPDFPNGTIRAQRTQAGLYGTPGTVLTFTIPSQYLAGSFLKAKGTMNIHVVSDITVSCTIKVKVNSVVKETITLTRYAPSPAANVSTNFERYIPVVGDDIVSVDVESTVPGGENIFGYDIKFYGDDAFPFTVPHPTWS